ncbi:Protein IQ-DOMAIN 14 [Bienertia sinuspersici]
MKNKDSFSSVMQQVNYSNVSKMGKKGSWFSAIKRVFTHSSKEKVTDGFGVNKFYTSDFDIRTYLFCYFVIWLSSMHHNHRLRLF